MSGEGMLWICWDGTHVTAAAVTQLVTYPTGKVFMSVPFLGGSGLNEFIDSLAINIIDVAKHNGASGVEIPGGRAGWLRPLAKYGMKRTKLQWMEKEINEFD